MPRRRRGKVRSSPKTFTAFHSKSLKTTADCAFRSKDFHRAINLYSNALAALQSDNDSERNESVTQRTALLSNRCSAHFFLKQYEYALSDADAIIAIRPNWSRGHLRRGKTLGALLRFEEALQELEQALQLEISAGTSPDDKRLRQLHRDVMNLPYDVLTYWLERGGAVFPTLVISRIDADENSNHRGVIVRQHIDCDQEVLQVPLEFIMTTDLAKQSTVGQQIISSGIVLQSHHTYLACFLLIERARGSTSFFAPYIRTLPQHYDNMPINFSEEEIALLQGSLSLNKIACRIEALKSEYRLVVDSVPSAAFFSFDDFCWARHVVITRIFGMFVDGRKSNGLVPLADMLNHKRPRQTKWTFDQERRAFTITTLSGVREGEEIFDSYGRKCNSRFFVNYGFTLMNNEDNEACFTFSLDETTPLFLAKQRILCKAPQTFQIPGRMNDLRCKNCFCFLRLLYCNEEEWSRISNYPFDLSNIQPISIRNELAVLQALYYSVECTIDAFPTTRVEDDSLLESAKLNANMRNCVCMRRGEKLVCEYFLSLSTFAIALLESQSVTEFDKMLLEQGEELALFQPYIEDICELFCGSNIVTSSSYL